MKSINPANGLAIRDYPEIGEIELNQRLDAARFAFRHWSRAPLEHRADLMRQVVNDLRERREPLARLMAEEMGKPLPQGRSEVEKCAWVCDYYADHSACFLASEPIATDAEKSYVAFRPLGVILAVMPWNFPLWQVFRFAAPSLMAGNVGLLKHAANVQGCATAIADIFVRAGFGEGVFQNLVIRADRVQAVIQDPRVQAVTLTGSTAAGRDVARVAGESLKKTVLELGGSDPYVVLADCNLDRTVEACVTSRLLNSGQSCIAAKRFIVEEAVRDEFTTRFVEQMQVKRFGNPLDENVDLGPLARTDLRDALHDQVCRSVAAGATLILGGEVPDGPGAFYPPTVLTGVRKGMPAYSEETFGPVASILPAKNEIEALAIANDSVFGLGAAIFSGNVTRAETLAREELEAGCCFVNDFVRSDPRLPFGGIKESGYGRELSAFGMREFVNLKTVCVGVG